MRRNIEPAINSFADTFCAAMYYVESCWLAGLVCHRVSSMCATHSMRPAAAKRNPVMSPSHYSFGYLISTPGDPLTARPARRILVADMEETPIADPSKATLPATIPNN